MLRSTSCDLGFGLLLSTGKVSVIIIKFSFFSRKRPLTLAMAVKNGSKQIRSPAKNKRSKNEKRPTKNGTNRSRVRESRHRNPLSPYRRALCDAQIALWNDKNYPTSRIPTTTASKLPQEYRYVTFRSPFENRLTRVMRPASLAPVCLLRFECRAIWSLFFSRQAQTRHSAFRKAVRRPDTSPKVRVRPKIKITTLDLMQDRASY